MKTAFLVPYLLFAPDAAGARDLPRKKNKKNIKKNTKKKKLAKHGGDGVRGRIVGGEPAPLDAYPWFVGLFDASFDDRPFCGATLVSREYALTAAHCLFELEFFNCTARVGAYAAPFGDGRDDPTQNGGQAVQSLAVAEVKLHPSYDYISESMDFDFGLIKLAAPATAAPVPIDGRDGRDVVAGYGPGKTGLFAAGFGETEDSFFGSDNLLQVDLNFLPQDVCQEALDDAFDEDAFDDDYFFFDDDYFDDDAFNVEVPRLSDSMMCATDDDQGYGLGDGGGPLYDQEAETQVGVISETMTIDSTGVGVYSRISAAFPWIQQTICAGTDDPDSDPFCQGYTLQPTSAPTVFDCEQSTVEVAIKTDVFPYETTWTLVEQGEESAVASGGPYKFPFTLFEEKICLPAGVYTFAIEDSNGDGICCEYGEGSYEVSLDGVVVAQGSVFADFDETTFVVSASPTASPSVSAAPTPCVPSGGRTKGGKSSDPCRKAGKGGKGGKGKTVKSAKAMKDRVMG